MYSAELNVQVEQLEYTVQESQSMVQISAFLTPPAGGLEIPLAFLASLQDMTTSAGQSYAILCELWLYMIYIANIPQPLQVSTTLTTHKPKTFLPDFPLLFSVIMYR